ncbi:MAG TPA: hypothetical protein DEV93_21295 [Chloroflexi bacterium]|jgi:hypothetical protein|nr:hypothetical protein [Chloroflexota bacterium]
MKTEALTLSDMAEQFTELALRLDVLPARSAFRAEATKEFLRISEDLLGWIDDYESMDPGLAQIWQVRDVVRRCEAQVRSVDNAAADEEARAGRLQQAIAEVEASAFWLRRLVAGRQS